ncbi:hypothetical protein GUJ93_ZPchr0002g25581 [Zizania palustris]|uniref:Uncharacterized protein n=1 Tax=Zizania palustris TaxID=103762 RepID=A0A8J5SFZ1_ZIZPA|nr:hypothetical protein GUJ93_ZPchr0002g25581 [Zizania palustris]
MAARRHFSPFLASSHPFVVVPLDRLPREERGLRRCGPGSGHGGERRTTRARLRKATTARMVGARVVKGGDKNRAPMLAAPPERHRTPAACRTLASRRPPAPGSRRRSPAALRLFPLCQSIVGLPSLAVTQPPASCPRYRSRAKPPPEPVAASSEPC